MAERIINADDFGKSKEVTLGILKAFERGYITRTTLMVNMPWCEYAVEEARKKNVYDKIGLHLNLTEGKPLTQKIRNIKSLCDENGLFKGNIRLVVRNRKLKDDEREAIREEIKAQIEKYMSFNLPLCHIDSHHHVHTELQILRILLPLAVNFHSMRISRNLIPFSLHNILKIIFKGIINRQIKNNFHHTKYFGSYSDYFHFYVKGSVEIMVHPVLSENDVVFDIVSKDKLCDMDKYVYLK